MKHSLSVRLIQSDTVWEKVSANLRNLDSVLGNPAAPSEKADLIVLPETFSTGFSMNARHLAETLQGSVVRWMKEKAQQHSAVITGSVIIVEDKKYYNRLLWVTPTGSVDYYDKRHLFSLMGEDKSYAPGCERKVFSLEGWRVCPQVCYDLRFPVWCRNRSDYDVLLFVANWPTARHRAWKSLLLARAIENQAFVIGVNRAGSDGNSIDFGGSSQVFDPLGEQLAELGTQQESRLVSFQADRLHEIREKFPFLNDRDDFSLI